ncbi:DUF6250 domain-containing protein [Endozoicomonas sp. SESOKO1]|uniref:DUF6250 domain-containing protein n=1 Tax=Endozoicomonas sp. SESOKO1 TaxID=2828742 RepID=UPI0021494EBF|nr:DUF6250 domain-containing protein [Endozoicomonas sp. SESOKO1]
MMIRKALLIGCSAFLMAAGSAQADSPEKLPDNLTLAAHLYSDKFDTSLDQWVIEQLPASSTTLLNGQMDIDDAGGTTVWFREKLQAPVMVEFDATMVMAGGPNDRGSDLNFFWMATDPASPDFFARSKERGGDMRKYDSMSLYYVGYGANDNTTTRMRRYPGDGTRPLMPEHDLSGESYRNKINTPMKIRLVHDGVRWKMWRDEVLVYDILDEQPFVDGYFGFRTWKSHMQIDNFRVYRVKPALEKKVLPPAQELADYKRQIAGFETFANNNKKRMSWQQGPTMLGINAAYLATGDLSLFDQSLRLSDELLARRNDPEKGDIVYTAGKRARVWPTISKQYIAKGRQQPFTNTILTAMILQPIAENARIIMETPALWDKSIPFGEQYLADSGTTYGEKAAFYLQEIEKTLNDFIFPDWYEAKTNLLKTPDTREMREIEPDLAGRYPAWNRSLAMMQVLDDLARTRQLMDDTSDRVAFYQSMVQSQLDFFFDDIEIYTQNGKTYYYWYYAPADRDSRQEDSSHGRLDLQILTRLYNNGDNPYGLTREKMQPFVDTFLDIMLTGNDSEVTAFIKGSNADFREAGSSSKAKKNKAAGPFIVLGWAGNEVMEVAEKTLAKNLSLSWTPWLWYYRNHNASLQG